MASWIRHIIDIDDFHKNFPVSPFELKSHFRLQCRRNFVALIFMYYTLGEWSILTVVT